MNIYKSLSKLFEWRWFRRKPKKRQYVSLPQELRGMVLSLDVEDIGMLYFPGIGDTTITPLWDTLPNYTYNLGKVNTIIGSNRIPKLPNTQLPVSVNMMCHNGDYYVPFREIGQPFLNAVIDFCDLYIDLSDRTTPIDKSLYAHHVNKLAVLDKVASDIIIIINPIVKKKIEQQHGR